MENCVTSRTCSRCEIDVRLDKTTGIQGVRFLLQTSLSISRSSKLSSLCLVIKKYWRPFSRQKNIGDGAYVKSNRLFVLEKNALQLQLYYDVLETATPLHRNVTIQNAIHYGVER